MEELRLEDTGNVYQLDTMVYHKEEGNDMALRWPGLYQEWSDVFSQEKIQALPELW